MIQLRLVWERNNSNGTFIATGMTPLHTASRAGNIGVAKGLLDLGAEMDNEVVQRALHPKMLTLLMHYNANPFYKSVATNMSPFQRFMKHSPLSAVAILDQGIGTNFCDPDDSNFLITMDLGYFNEMRKADR